MIVLRGKIARQVVVESIFGQPLQCIYCRFLRHRFRAARRFDVHNKCPVTRQIDSAFRYDYLAVEMCAESNHLSRFA